MEKKEIKQNYKRNTNKPIYQYKKISYYFNDSDENDDEEEFSYTINDKKIQALKEQKIKNESKMSKTFKVENKMILSKSQMNINLVENDMEKSASTSLMPKIPKKKKIVVKKKKIKKTNKNAPIPISLTEKKEIENDSEKNNNNTEDLKNEEETPEKNPLMSSFSKDNKNDISDNQINEYDNNILSNSQNLLNMPDFFGFELEEKDNNNNISSKKDFIFDETKENKKEKKLKKNKSQKRIKTIKKKKKHIEKKINEVKIDEKNIESNNNNNYDISKCSLTNEDIKEFKIIDDGDADNKENNEDETNNISTSNNDSNVDSKNIKLRNYPVKLQNDNQEISATKIQSIWRAYQTQKRIKFLKLVKNFIEKFSIIIKNKNKDYYSDFIEKINERKKNKNIKLKNQKHSKKLKGLNTLIEGLDTQKLNELIEKEKKYDILLAKYEEVMKELEKVKKEMENKKAFFNQNLNLIDNKNQNISINIFPNDTSKKNQNEINVDEISEKNNDFNKPNNQMYERYTKINEISNIKILSKSKQDSKNFIINRNISVQILNIKQNENILFDQKYFNLYKIFNNLNEKNKFYLRNYFDQYKSIANSLNCVEKYIKFEKITKRRNLVINLVKSFSINKNESRNKSKTRKIIKLVPKKSIKKKPSNSNISNNINTFSESKLVINKIISKFNIIQKNNIYDKDKYNNLVITKLINNFNINPKKRSDFVITKVLNEFKINGNSDKNKAIEKGKLIITENSHITKKKAKSFKKKDINYASDKINNQSINIANNNYSNEEQIINYLKQNRMIIEKIKNDFHLNRSYFNENELFINKIKSIYFGKIKKKENVISKYASNDFMINRINKRNNLVITKIENNFKIVKKKKNNNFIITKVVENYDIHGDNTKEDSAGIVLSVSDTYQLKISSTEKKKKSKTSQYLIINKVINDFVIDKIITKNNSENKFKESKLIINKIINNFSIRRLKKDDFIINKSFNNNFMLYNNNNKNFNFVITKVHNKFNIKRTMISQCKEDIKEQQISKYNNIKDKLVINKVISKLNYQKIKKKENIITKTINESIMQRDNNLIIEKNENLLSMKQNSMNLNKSNIDKNLIITKIISKLFIISTKKPKREKKGRKFKSKFLFVSDNNQLFIKRNKKLNRDKINNNIFNENNNNTKEKDLENSIQEINLGKIDEGNIRKDSDIKKKRIKKFKSKNLFISDNNQLKIKGIKNKK